MNSSLILLKGKGYGIRGIWRMFSNFQSTRIHDFSAPFLEWKTPVFNFFCHLYFKKVFHRNFTKLNQFVKSNNANVNVTVIKVPQKTLPVFQMHDKQGSLILNYNWEGEIEITISEVIFYHIKLKSKVNI